MEKDFLGSGAIVRDKEKEFCILITKLLLKGYGNLIYLLKEE